MYCTNTECKYQYTLDFLANAVFLKYKLTNWESDGTCCQQFDNQFKWLRSEGAVISVISRFFCFFFWFHKKQNSKSFKNVERHKVEIHELKSSALQKRTILNKCTNVKPPEINHENLKSSARLVSLKVLIYFRFRLERPSKPGVQVCWEGQNNSVKSSTFYNHVEDFVKFFVAF